MDLISADVLKNRRDGVTESNITSDIDPRPRRIALLKFSGGGINPES
jgi:hypothetical protein